METVVSLMIEAYMRIARLIFWKRRNAKFIIMLGGPGAGKGTVAAVLSEKLGLPHLNVGHLLRREIEKGTSVGRRWGAVIKAGKLVPESVVHSLLSRELNKPDYYNGAVLDGGARTLSQARQLRRLLMKWGNQVDVALFVDASDEDLVERLSLRWTCTGSDCGKTYHERFNPPAVAGICDSCHGKLSQRDDDRPEVIRERLATFHASFAPIRKYYEDAGVLLTISSTNTQGTAAVCQAALFAVEEID